MQRMKRMTAMLVLAAVATLGTSTAQAGHLMADRADGHLMADRTDGHLMSDGNGILMDGIMLLEITVDCGFMVLG